MERLLIKAKAGDNYAIQLLLKALSQQMVDFDEK